MLVADARGPRSIILGGAATPGPEPQSLHLSEKFRLLIRDLPACAPPLDDLEPQALARRGAGGNLALVAGIAEQVLKPGETLADPGADQAQAVAVLDAGGMDDQPQRQAQRVGEQMPLAAVDLLARVEAARAARLGGLDALAVDDRGGRRPSRPACSRAAMSSVAWIVDQTPSCQNRRK